jgi:hypothetical protein
MRQLPPGLVADGSGITRNGVLSRALSRIAVAIGCIGGVAASGSGAVTGLEVVYEGISSGKYVYSVYALSNAPNDVLVNVYNHRVVSGSMASVQHDDLVGGIWNPLFTPTTSFASDSFVTVTGVAGQNSNTNLDPAFGSGFGSVIPDLAGWFSSTPTALLAFGSSGRIKIMQVAGSSLQPYQAQLQITYKFSQSSGTALFTEPLTYTIPGVRDSDGDGYNDLNDCGPNDPTTYPGAPELCSTVGVDNNCNGSISDVDTNAPDKVDFYADLDNDTWTTAQTSRFCPGTTNPGFRAAISSPLDCNDLSPAIYPGAPELCSTVGTDNNCDGYINDVDANAPDKVTFFTDADSDGYTLATGALFCPGTTNPGFRATVSSPLDCNDGNSAIYPGAPELCSTVGTDNNCDGYINDVDANAPDKVTYFADADNDGYTLATGALFCPGTTNPGFRATVSSPLDCDDSNPAAYPGAPELCSTVGTDNNCDGYANDVDANAPDKVTFFTDGDSDGYTLATGALFCPGTTNPGFRATVSSPLDCNDDNPAIYPGAPELCSTVGTDDNCDGYVNDIDANAPDKVTFFADADNDGYTLATGALFCPGTTNPGFRATISSPLDCNDENPAIYPGAPELCSTVGTDNNCDGYINDVDANAPDKVAFFADADNDGYTLATGSPFCPGTTNPGFRATVSSPLDCDDSNPAAYPGAPELCSTVGTDNNCDGYANDVDANAPDKVTFFTDGDSDGYTLATGALFCPGTTNPGFRASVSSPLDCNDDNPAIYPGAPELCSTVGTDDNCDGYVNDIDANAPDKVTFFADGDDDGYTLATGSPFCPGTTNPGFRATVSSPLDCNDSDPAAYPGAPELCSTVGTDNNCDGYINDVDANAPDKVTFFTDGDSDGYTLATGALFCPGTTNPGFRASVSSPLDCNDDNPAIYPGAPELCSTVGTDDNCDGYINDVDANAPDKVTFFADADSDGYTLATGALFCPGTTNPGFRATVSSPLDCNDENPAIYPGAPELCSTVGTDNNCNGNADDVDANAPDKVTFFADADSDGYTLATGSPFCPGTTNPGFRATVSSPLDCNDSDPAAYPGAPELCSTVGTDNNCDGYANDVDANAPDKVTFFTDGDSDGYTLATGALFCPGTTNPGFRASVSSPLDCNDDNPAIYPGAPELCSTVGTDDNCDGYVNDIDANAPDKVTLFADSDNDGYTLATGALFCPGTTNPGFRAQVSDPPDCDDSNAAAYPGAPELCSTVGTDNNCDGYINDVDANAPDKVTFFTDADSDGYTLATGALFCPGTTNPGFRAQVSDPLDCDDDDPAIYPGAPELCDSIGIDNNCDGDAYGDTYSDGSGGTFYLDIDGDGFGDDAYSLFACEAPPGYVPVGGDLCPTNPFTQEPFPWYRDADGDKFGDPDDMVMACSQPQGYVPKSGDCDDADPLTGPGATETCNQADDNCDGLVDEGLPTFTFYPDSDGDGFGNADAAVEACSAPAGHITTGGDCNDTNAAIYPGAPELCSTVGTDDNCNGNANDVDPDASDRATFYLDIDGDGFGDDESTILACSAPDGYVPVGGDQCPTNPFTQAPIPWYLDADGDQFGDSGISVTACAQPDGHVPKSGDCDDDDPLVNPAAIEACNGIDDNCNELIDEDFETFTFYLDTDGDGFGDTATATEACASPGNGWVTAGGDNCPGISNPSQDDCDGDGVGDACTKSPDCNDNGVPDSCEDGSIRADTGAMTFAGAAGSATAALPGQLQSTTPVTVRVNARTDLGAADAFLSLRLNGVAVGGDLFRTTGASCPQSQDTVEVTMAASEWATVLASGRTPGTVSVVVTPSEGVDVGSCASSSVRVTIAYGGPSYDCDGDGTSDLCQIAAGASDCNDNGVLDSCETGGPGDTDSNGIPDSCQIAYGDFDLSGEIDSSDLSFLLAAWDASGPIDADLNGDGTVDGEDLALLLARWGPLP